jgi:hypothetical protein
VLLGLSPLPPRRSASLRLAFSIRSLFFGSLAISFAFSVSLRAWGEFASWFNLFMRDMAAPYPLRS